MSILKYFKDLFIKERTATGWRDAAKQSNLPIKAPTPKFPANIKLCAHLNVTEKTRLKLENLLMENWNSRSENLLEDFFNICSSDNVNPIFPGEIRELVLNRYKRAPNEESLRKKVATIYMRHELNVLRSFLELADCNGKVKRVKIRTSEDGLVCPTCRKHANKTHSLEKAPVLPLCWECRCYYEPVIK